MGTSIFPKLEGLDALAQRGGVDTRPTLVRVLTDLYVQKAPHSAEEERHYTELVLGLLDAVDVPTRAGIAQKLATYPSPPPMVVRRLARDVIEVAEPILRHAKTLSGSDLLAIIRDCGPRHAAAIAARNAAVQLPPAPSAGQTHPGDVDLDAIFADALDPEPAEPDGTPEAIAPADRRELAEMFLAGDAQARRSLLASLADGHAKPTPSAGPVSETVRMLEIAALERRPQEFAAVLEQALGITADYARRIAEDASGEPVLVAARALDIPSDILLRILLFLNPAIGESVEAVFALSRFYDMLPLEAARRLVAGMQADGRKPAHQPLHYDDATGRKRRGAPLAARRSGATESHRELPLRDAALRPRQRTS